ncbi:MAG: hypothetical protein ABID61_04470 [Candidatus Micrarchaeota archaeon]
MEFDELLITTGVDALVRLVKEKQRVELEDASATLNIPSNTLEEWARVLEEESILRLEYRLTKIYLVWVKPSEEEIVTEKQSFYEEKNDIENRAKKFGLGVKKEIADLGDLKESFSVFYAKMYGRMEDLEKKISPVPAAKTISDDALVKYTNELGEVEKKLNEIKFALGEVREEISSIEVHADSSKSQTLLEKIEKGMAEIKEIETSMDEVRKKSTSTKESEELHMPTIKDLKKKFEGMQKEFAALRAKNAQIRQDMLSLHESSEILKNVAESIMGKEDKIADLRKETHQLSQEIDELLEKTSKIASNVKQNADLMERLGNSVDVAKGILNRFPSQESVMTTLDKLRADENALAEKNESLEKLLEIAGGKQVTTKQATELMKKVDEKIEQTKEELDSMEATLNEEKGTYLTFQKIKERIVPSLEGYQTQLETMEQRIIKIRDDTNEQIKAVKTEVQKLDGSLKDGQMQEMVKIAQEVKEKKKMLDEIKQTLIDLEEMSDNLNKRVTLLSREAKLLEIRSESSVSTTSESKSSTKAEQKEKSVRQQLELSEEEELEFKQKREELKKLIQKLWE